MSTLSLQAAYQELADNFAFYTNPANRQALLELTGKLDATNSPGAVTLAYSGYMNSDLHSTDVIKTIVGNSRLTFKKSQFWNFNNPAFSTQFN